ncbi:Cell cycle control protein 50B [Varanus komodoensis]|uniref:cell cycle control protein 50B n=1 Tax=Varanus komodoensis TaxID=61221 RepID=UPI001CF7DC6A|nr:cell cycle control protein 50B [Varanus komodoensis]KAF7242784.1 Cell cycle control protein 50B [Varanus komodoensis]
MASASYNVSRAQAPDAFGPGAAQNKPDNTAFTQQRLPAWQPLLSAGTVLPLFFCLGLAFVAIGLGLHFSSEQIEEVELDYTGALRNSNCSHCANLTSDGLASCWCTACFELPADFPAPVCLYYQLSNYFQNNRRYSVSRDDAQLSGEAWALRHPIQECQPYRTTAQGIPIAPCGSVANSLFNDTFELYRQLENGSQEAISLDKRGISWWTDTNVKFRNPEPVNGSLAQAFLGTAKPPFWHVQVFELDKGNPNNTGFVNEAFIVWMRIAALPTFRKLYARVGNGSAVMGLPQGTYCLNITYNYPVLSFHGGKKVIFSTLSWMGGKNPFLGIAYLVFGSVCVVTGIVMLVVHIKYRHLNEED